MLFCACTGKLHPLALRLVIRLAEAVKQYSAMSVCEVDLTMAFQTICEKLLLKQQVQATTCLLVCQYN